MNKASVAHVRLQLLLLCPCLLHRLEESAAHVAASASAA
jgi:hypothetical protein